MSKKGLDRILLCFIESYCLLPVFEMSSGVTRKCGLLRLSAPPLLTCTHSSCTPTVMDSPEFCACGAHHKHSVLTGKQRTIHTHIDTPALLT